MTGKRKGLVFLFLTASYMSLGNAANAQGGDAARLVFWHPNPGMSRDFEEGYKRHLGWHQRNQDTWNWFGWTFVSGEHYGDFVDGTFFHRWTDFDNPVAPAGDAADNAMNVFPYASVRRATSYERVAEATALEPANLSAPFLVFCWIDITPGRYEQFEDTIAKALEADATRFPPHLLLRPIDGTSKYLLVLPGSRASDAKHNGDSLNRLLTTVQESAKEGPAVLHVDIETARFRSDMSYKTEVKGP